MTVVESLGRSNCVTIIAAAAMHLTHVIFPAVKFQRECLNILVVSFKERYLRTSHIPFHP